MSSSAFWAGNKESVIDWLLQFPAGFVHIGDGFECTVCMHKECYTKARDVFIYALATIYCTL